QPRVLSTLRSAPPPCLLPYTTLFRSSPRATIPRSIERGHIEAPRPAARWDSEERIPRSIERGHIEACTARSTWSARRRFRARSSEATLTRPTRAQDAPRAAVRWFHRG